MSRNTSDSGCSVIGLIILIIQFGIFAIPPIYHYIVDDIVKGNCIFIIALFAIIDFVFILLLRRKYAKTEIAFERENNEHYEEKRVELIREYNEKQKELSAQREKLAEEYRTKQINLDVEVREHIEQLNSLQEELDRKKYNLDVEYMEKRTKLQAWKKDIEIEKIKYFEKCHKEQLKAQQDKKEIEDILYSKNIFTKVSSMYADTKALIYDQLAKELANKAHPALKASNAIQEAKHELRKTLQQLKLIEYKYEFLLNQFPQLRYYVDDYNDLQEALSNISIEEVDYDRVRDWLSPEEYDNLSIDDRNQLALDHWMQRDKSNLVIGYEYELYIGYLYRKEGWKVEQYGIDRGVEDLGRDIIASKYDPSTGKHIVHVVQCKKWSEMKEIHENVINQLYGTTVMYKLSLEMKVAENTTVIPVLVSSTSLTETAIRFAEELGVKYRVKPLENFPHIKCNINRTTGEKIYHLPFDQQYYTAKIEDLGECYVSTVKEAVGLGFRRAFRYSGM